MGVENHKVLVVRVGDVEPIPGADVVGLVHVLGYQVVVKKAEWKPGDLGIYIPPDSVVPDTPQFNWLWSDKLKPGTPPTQRQRRITVRRFKKMWSEGLLLPVKDFAPALVTPTEEWDELSKQFVLVNVGTIEGTDVAQMLGITHYDPDEGIELDGDSERFPSRKQSKIFPRSLRGWGYLLLRLITFGRFQGNTGGGGNEVAPTDTPPIYDVEAFKNHQNVFQSGEPVIVTEKIDGANARFVYVPGTFGWGHMFAGSRKLWKKEGTSCIWRQALKQNPWIEEWCKKHPGSVLYGEVVPAQIRGGVKMNYGCKDGEVGFFAFDIRKPDGSMHPAWVDVDITGHFVPMLYEGKFNLDLILPLVDGKSAVGDHIKEGIVIRALCEGDARNLPLSIRQLKIVSNAYLEKTK
jgi:hypothetical protein